MISKIVLKLEPITLLGGAELPEDGFSRALALAPTVVAADGGAAHAVQHGCIPEAVIGDMDSLSGELKASLPDKAIHTIDEQDSTDFEKCLMRIGAPVVLGLGFLGGRLDHQLAALHTLLRFAEQRCVLLGHDELIFLCPPNLDLPLEKGTPVSLFPMSAVVARAQGLKWSFDALDLAPGQRIGTSNEATGPLHLETDAPGLLCILPASCLEDVMGALLGSTGSWPARA
ncbi:MAG: thiamine diphosphokinase [Planktotalea sp.]|uniref:thiamine diphosphokinase n=1 Tax=Planktotalea sp. TaxID=2029877 RepID=UPI003C72EF9A